LSDRKTNLKVKAIISTYMSTNPENVVKIGQLHSETGKNKKEKQQQQQNICPR